MARAWSGFGCSQPGGDAMMVTARLRAQASTGRAGTTSPLPVVVSRHPAEPGVRSYPASPPVRAGELGPERPGPPDARAGATRSGGGRPLAGIDATTLRQVLDLCWREPDNTFSHRHRWPCASPESHHGPLPGVFWSQKIGWTWAQLRPAWAARSNATTGAGSRDPAAGTTPKRGRAHHAARAHAR